MNSQVFLRAVLYLNLARNILYLRQHSRQAVILRQYLRQYLKLYTPTTSGPAADTKGQTRAATIAETRATAGATGHWPPPASLRTASLGPGTAIANIQTRALDQTPNRASNTVFDTVLIFQTVFDTTLALLFDTLF